MTRTFFVTVIIFCFAGSATAQTPADNSITGIMINGATKLPLEYGTVTIFEKGNKRALTGTITDNTGAFTLTNIPSGTFTILFENIGYRSYTMNDYVITKKNAIIDLKHIALTLEQTTLGAVTVISSAKPFTDKIDKLVFNAEKDLSSQGGVATDLLKKIPQVSVDADGNVQLAGNSGIRFLINGKPSSAFGSSIADVLQSIPASQIKSIEVITNPGAKYDAQGLGGIINIILKTNNAQGYNGNISLTAGTRMENGSFNFNVKKNDFGVHTFFSGNKRLRSTVLNDNYRVTTDNNIISTLHQLSESRFQRQGFQTGGGFDWSWKKYNSISADISYNNFGNDGTGFTNQTLQQGAGLGDILSLIQAGNTFKFFNTDFSLDYKRTFKKEDQELEFGLNSSIGNNRSRSYNEEFFLPQDSLVIGTQGYNPAKIKETEFTIDYTQPVKKDIKLGIGSKLSWYDINSNAEVNSYQSGTKNYFPDASMSNGQKYNQKVYAFYSELSFPVAKLFDAKIGARYERTEISSYYSNAQQQVAVPGYNTLVPSIFLSKKLNDKQTLKLSYSKRIERPDYNALNPYVNTTDPKNLSTGNPYLKPELGHRFELGYSRDLGKTGSLMFSLFYRRNEHDIQPFIIYYPSYRVGDSLYTNVAVSTRQNIGTENNTGLNLFGDIHFTTKFSVRSNVSFFYRHTINAIDAGYNNNSFNYRFNINTSYQFTNLMSAEAFGNFNAARHEAQGVYPSFTSYTIAVRRQFWQKKGSLALTATNLFSESLNQRTILTGPNFTVSGVRTIPFRSIGLNFTWKFGKLEFKKKPDNGDMPDAAAAP